jgi:hypothetical protein
MEKPRNLVLRRLLEPWAAAIYFLDQLSQGTTLSKLVRERVDLNSGTFFAALPEEWEPGQVPDFWIGGLWSAYASQEAPPEFVRNVLRDPQSAVLFQDTMSRISDPYLENIPNKQDIITYGAEVYWYVDDRSFAADQSEKIAWAGSPYPSAAFFFKVAWPLARREMTDDDLRHVIETLMAIMVGAWDEESFILWWRDGVPRPWKREGRPI